MPETETATNLKSLHDLHRRARALRNLLESAPKTLANRQKALEARQKTLDEERNALKARKANIHKKETIVQGLNTKLDNLRVKLNSVKKNEEYKAIQNQIAHDQATITKLEDEILNDMGAVEEQTAELARLEAEVKAFADEVAALKADIESKAEGQQAQLREVEATIAASESIIPADARERFRRTIKQRGDNAFAPVDPQIKACSGCFLGITPQCQNDILNEEIIAFCKSCGRILYMDED